MKILHILKSEPDETTTRLIDIISKDEEAIRFNLYEDQTSYDQLIDLMFEHDKVISWW